MLAIATAQRGRTIRGPVDVVAAVGERLVELEQEGFVALALDARGRLLRVIDVALGTRTSVHVGVAEAFRELVRENAASAVFAHNHPSGDPTPSHEDRELTRQLTAAGRLLGIPVLDHIVLAAEGYRSLLSDSAAGGGITAQEMAFSWTRAATRL